MRIPVALAVLGFLVAACASGERPLYFPGTATHDVGFSCAAELLEDRGFLVVRDDDVGMLSAERGRNWVYVTIIPQEPLVYQMQVVGTRGVRDTAAEIAEVCGA